MFIKYPIRFLLIVIFSKLHKFIYNLTGGKLMGTLMGLPMIFLTTTGRVSNKPRTTPLTYLKDNDDFICVASFGGYKKHPDWYLNLQKNNRLKINVKGKSFNAISKTIYGKERSEIWKRVIQFYPGFKKYQERTAREIQIVRISIV